MHHSLRLFVGGRHQHLKTKSQFDDSRGKIIRTGGNEKDSSDDSSDKEDNSARDPKFSSSKLMKSQDLEPVLSMSKSHNPEDSRQIKIKGIFEPERSLENANPEELKFDGIGELPNQLKPRFSKPDNINVEGKV